MTPVQDIILKTLRSVPQGVFVSAEEIIYTIRDAGFQCKNEQSLRVIMTRLREKLPDGNIFNERGSGYIYVAVRD